MRLLLLLTVLLMLYRCTPAEPPSPFAHLTDPQVKEILEKAIEQAGGWQAWQSIDSIFYTKRTILYDSLGQLESDRWQVHRYQLRPELAMSIAWKEGNENHEIVCTGNESVKLVNKTMAEADPNALHRTAMSAYYVLFMPFKLLDPGVELTYKGIVTLPNRQQVHSIGADYDPENNDNHSTNDYWEYYFDQHTGDFIANMVHHGTYFALIFNETFTTAGGLRFNAYRNSYRVDSTRQHLWKRGEFYYKDFILK